MFLDVFCVCLRAYLFEGLSLFTVTQKVMNTDVSSFMCGDKAWQ